jgi:hypothetical protein
MSRVRDHQSPAEQAGNAMLDERDRIDVIRMSEHEERVKELLEANNRFEQRGRMAERMARFLENLLLDQHGLKETRRNMALSLLAQYRKEFPRAD